MYSSKSGFDCPEGPISGCFYFFLKASVPITSVVQVREMKGSKTADKETKIGHRHTTQRAKH